MHKRGKPRLSKRPTPRVTALERDAGSGFLPPSLPQVRLTPGTEPSAVGREPLTAGHRARLRERPLTPGCVGRDGLRVLRYAIATAAASPEFSRYPLAGGISDGSLPIREYRGIRSDWSLRGGERVPRGEGARPLLLRSSNRWASRSANVGYTCTRLRRDVLPSLGYSIWSTLLHDLPCVRWRGYSPSPTCAAPRPRLSACSPPSQHTPVNDGFLTSGEETDGAGPSEAISSSCRARLNARNRQGRQVRVRDQGWITAAPGRDDR